MAHFGYIAIVNYPCSVCIAKNKITRKELKWVADKGREVSFAWCGSSGDFIG